MKTGKLSSHMEDYLEAVAALKKKTGAARVRDIGELLKVKKPSVTAAINSLAKAGFVIHERYGYVELTPAGRDIAADIQARHDIMVKFLVNILSIDPQTADEEACRLEHSLSPATFEKLSKFMAFTAHGPDGGRPEWLKGFDRYFRTGRRPPCRFRQRSPDMPRK